MAMDDFDDFDAMEEDYGRKKTGRSRGSGGDRSGVIVALVIVIVLCVAMAAALVIILMNAGESDSSDRDSGLREKLCSHDWERATCTDPKTCEKCGKTEGKKNGHSWLDASCTAPRTCEECGVTEGTAVGHTWAEPTCDTPGKCTACGRENAPALGHIWQKATFISAQTCSRCSGTQGSPRNIRDVDVAAEITYIKDVYYGFQEMKDKKLCHKVALNDDIDAWYDDMGNLKRVVVRRGTAGIGSDSDVYSRTYYFDNDVMVFAFYEGKKADDAHRFYFVDELLFQWTYKGVKDNFSFTTEYLVWEQVVLEELAYIRANFAL